MRCDTCKHSHPHDVDTDNPEYYWQRFWMECRYKPPKFVPWGRDLSDVYFQRTMTHWFCGKHEPKNTEEGAK